MGDWKFSSSISHELCPHPVWEKRNAIVKFDLLKPKSNHGWKPQLDSCVQEEISFCSLQLQKALAEIRDLIVLVLPSWTMMMGPNLSILWCVRKWMARSCYLRASCHSVQLLKRGRSVRPHRFLGTCEATFLGMLLIEVGGFASQF